MSWRRQPASRSASARSCWPRVARSRATCRSTWLIRWSVSGRWRSPPAPVAPAGHCPTAIAHPLVARHRRARTYWIPAFRARMDTSPAPPGFVVPPRQDGAVTKDVLDGFGVATREWFRAAFAAPTDAQAGAWRAVGGGRNALVVAPTGSGKTLAAFLWSLDRLTQAPPPPDPRRRCRVLYVSPLKALAVDVERNLRAPLTGIRQAAARLGFPPPDITVGMRTGDTPADERRAFGRTPPDILITTPESLFLLLTSAARDSLRSVETVIVDEVHAVAATKRGAHLALSLERLDALLRKPAERVGRPATVRDDEDTARFLGGAHAVEVVQPRTAKTIEVSVQVPVADMTRLDELSDQAGEPGDELGGARRASIWPAVEERVLDLIE